VKQVMSMRRDEELRGLDVDAAITMGMALPGTARAAMFAEVAIAASWQLQDLGVGPYPVSFLASCVRSMGLEGALELPEPLIGHQPTALVREWMSAAAGLSRNIARDDLFARWLEMVAALLHSRKELHRINAAVMVDFTASENPPAGPG
jgi:hypothetical protein